MNADLRIQRTPTGMALINRLRLLVSMLVAASGLTAHAQRAALLPSETGVWHCSMHLSTSDFSVLEGNALAGSSFKVFVALRYLTSPGCEHVGLKGYIAADLPATLEEIVRFPRPKRPPYDPPHVWLDVGLTLLAGDLRVPLKGQLRFPTGSIQRRTQPGVITGSFTVPPGTDPAGLQLRLTARGLHGQACEFRPASSVNRLSNSSGDDASPSSSVGGSSNWIPSSPAPDTSRDLSIHQAAPAALPEMPSEAIVVMKPPYGVHPGLIDRHVQHYLMLGLTRYLLYLRPADVQPFLDVPNLAKWVRQGRLVIVEWDAVDEHIGLPAWDQRLVYNHAVLAFLGRPVYLFMPDIDEYLVPIRPGLESFFDMARECFPASKAPGQGGGPVNVRIPRRHILVADWSDRQAPEKELWLSPEVTNPLERYSLINDARPPMVKSLVNPNFVDLFYIHHASSIPPYDYVEADRGCVVLGHMSNLHVTRVQDAKLISDLYYPEPGWVAALGRLAALRSQWLFDEEARSSEEEGISYSAAMTH